MTQQNKICREALEELSDYRLRQTAILNLGDELRAVDLLLEEGGDAELAKKRSRLFTTLGMLRIETERVRRAVEALDEREAYLLEQMYVQKTPVFDIMEALCIEKSAFYRLRRRAVDSFVHALYGIRPRASRGVPDGGREEGDTRGQISED